jgi:hypothetical protein
MSGHLHNLIFGLAAAFVLPLVGFAVGMVFSKVIGGWQDSNIRRWWTTFCLVMPFVFLGMMTKRMAEDGFEGLRASWSADPLILFLIIAVAALLSASVVIAIVRLWCTSQS